MNHSLLALAVALAMASTAHADEIAKPASATELDAVSVIGSGELRQVQRITPENLDVLPPGTSPQKVLNLLPGVNAQSTDALGTNEQSMTLSLRGFTGTKLGHTLDGVPLGDSAYNNYNGLSINRALVSENLGMVELAQGIGNLSTPSTSNLGGAIAYFSNAPSKQMGGRVVQTFGSDGNRRSFGRFDSGEYNGFSMYVSGMHARSDLWNDQSAYNDSITRQFNTKAVYETEALRLTGFADASRTTQANYFYLSRDSMARGLGWDWGGYAPDWNKAVAKAYCNKNTFNAARCDSSGPDTDADGAFTAGQILRNDDLYYLSGEFFASDTLTLRALAYRHEDAGEGHNWNSGAWSNKGTAQELPIIFRNTLYSIDRRGGTLGIEWEIGAHRVQLGGWYEQNTSSASRYQSAVDGPRDFSGLAKGQPDVGVFAQETEWKTRQFYLQDTVRLLDDRLRLEAGFKAMNAQSQARALPGIAKTPISPTSNNQFATGNLRARDSFLPSAGVYFQLDAQQEVFASYAENIAMFQGGFKLGPQAVSQATWNSQGTLKPEQSRTFELGYRWIGERTQLSLAGYDVRFDNRLLQYNPCDSRQPVGPECGNRFYNVGSVNSRGAELTVLWTPTAHVSWYNSASFNDSSYGSDYMQNGVVVPTKGKTQTDTPKTLLSSELKWRNGPWSAELRGKYTGKRYYTYTNDQGFGGFTVFDAGAAYDFGQLGFVQKLKLSLNVTNLGDKRYASNLDSSVFAPTDAAGKLYVFHASAPRQAFISLDARF